MFDLNEACPICGRLFAEGVGLAECTHSAAPTRDELFRRVADLRLTLRNVIGWVDHFMIEPNSAGRQAWNEGVCPVQGDAHRLLTNGPIKSRRDDLRNVKGCLERATISGALHHVLAISNAEFCDKCANLICNAMAGVK